MENIKPLVIELKTAKQQAEYFFNREFNALDDFNMLITDGEPLDIMYPSDKILVKEFFDNSYANIDEVLTDYNDDNETEEVETDYFDNHSFIEYVSNMNSFYDYKYGDLEHYPMWNTIWRCDRFYIDSAYCNVDTLYEMGIGVIDHESGYYLFINGAGYSFHDAHWIHLFKHLNWIETID